MSSLASKIVAACHRPARWLRRAMRWLLLSVAALWLLVLTLWLILYFGILPNVDRWRPEVEARATQWLGSSVRIERMSVRTGGWMPVLELRNVRLLDANGQSALTLPEVSAALSVRSFLSRIPRLEQLYLHGPQLAIRIDAQGRVWVAGQALGRAQGDGTALADWLFSQHEVAIKGGSVSWLDERRPDAKPLQLTQVDGLLRNGLRRHEARLDATPPPEWGQRFTLRARFSQPLLARAGDWQRWNGVAYAELPQAQVAQVRTHLRLPFDLQDGEGRLRAWLRIEQGRTQAVDADLALHRVDLRLASAVERLQLSQLQVRLGWQLTREGSRWQAKGLSFAHAAAGADAPVRWPVSNLTLNLVHPAHATPWQPGVVQGGRLQVDRLDLGLLAQLGRALPLGAPLQDQLSARMPQGDVTSLDAQWQGALNTARLPPVWRINAAATDLALQALPAPASAPEMPHPLGQPGWRGASITLSASQSGGEARLVLRDGALSWPGLLAEDEIATPRAELQAQWQRSADRGWDVQLKPSTLTTSDIELKIDGRWRSGADAKHPRGHLMLNASAPKLDVRALPRYLPAPLVITRRYLTEALQSGFVRNIVFKLDGPLHEFPFAATNTHSKGVFRVTARADKVRYAFVPSHVADDARPAYVSPWPALDDVSGEVVFEGAGMSIRNARALSGDLQAFDVNVRIPDLAHQPTVEVEGQWRGLAPAALAYVKASPIGGWTQHILDNTRAAGSVQGQVRLTLPLQNMSAARASGDVQLADVNLQLRPDLPPLRQVRGLLSYTQQGFTLQPSTAQFLGGELRLEGGSVGAPADRQTRLNAAGTFTSDGLRAAQEWNPLPALAQSFSGSARYSARLQWKDGLPDFDIRSTLQGLASNLPEPLRKASESSLPLRIGISALDAQRDRWALDVGTLLGARYERDRGTGAVLRGGIHVSASGAVVEPAVPDHGVALTLSLPKLDLDAWAPVAKQISAAAARPPGLDGAAQAATSAGGYLPNQGSVQAEQLRLQGRTLNGVIAGVSVDGRVQRVTLQSDRVAGFLEWTPGQNAPGTLKARLTRLSLPKTETERVEQWVDGGQAATSSWPTVDAVVDEFELRGLRLGKLELQATAAAAGRDWPITQLNIQHPDASLKASGLWRAQAGRTQMDWALSLANSGRWLDALGYPNTVRGGKGELKGQLGWKGSPLSPDPALMDGAFTIQLERGQFLKADPGVARLLGVLSLQSLPRRLLFDWRDVFNDGFSFDDFGGSVAIEAGIARTSDLRMRGVQASVLMDGSADLAHQTTDLRVLIVPDVNVGGASLAYAAINPAIGLTTFLAQLILRRPMAAAGTTQFHVRGPWAAPHVDKIDKPDIPSLAAPPPFKASSAPAP